LKGLLKGFWWPFRLLKLVKYSWSYGPNEVCDIETCPGKVDKALYKAGHIVKARQMFYEKKKISK